MYTRKQATAGGQAAEKFAEALSKSGAVLETPLYPFKAGCIRFANLTGKDVGKYGAYHFDKSDKEILRKTVGFPVTQPKLRLYLAKHCNIQNPDNLSWLAIIEMLAESPKKKPEASGGKAEDIRRRFEFDRAQAFFDGKDLQLPAGAEIDTVEILKKLVQSFGKVVAYKNLDENGGNIASDFLRGKIRTIKYSLKKHRVPCKIQSKKWSGYFLSKSLTHSS
jgi:hypothetical protein